MSRNRAPQVAWIASLTLVVLTTRAGAVVFDDGGLHMIDGPSDAIRVTDAADGSTTTVLIVEPAIVSGFGGAITAEALHGGEAVVEMTGGTLLGEVNAEAGSRIDITGGSVGTDPFIGYSIQANGAMVNLGAATLAGDVQAFDASCVTIDGTTVGSSTAARSLLARNSVVRLLDGTFDGGISAEGNSDLTIQGGSYGQGSSGASANLRGLAGQTTARITGGGFSGGVSVASNSRVTIDGGSFGGASDSSVIAYGPSGAATAQINNGTFAGGISIQSNGHVTVSGGTFGTDLGGESTSLSGIGGLATFQSFGGDFESGLRMQSRTRARLSGGSFGILGLGPIGPPMSVQARGVDDTAIVEVFGGSFAGGFDAREDAQIHVYGFGLSIDEDQLTGTLADGTPINIATSTSLGGQIVLHAAASTVAIDAGIELPRGSGGSIISLPSSLFPRSRICDADAPLPVALPLRPVAVDLTRFGINSSLPTTADAIIRRTATAVNPPNAPFTDTVPIELVALQLRSAEPVDLTGFNFQGEDYLYLTLQSNRGPNDPPPQPNGAPSIGAMTVDFALQHYEASIDVYFDLRVGGLEGPIVFSDHDLLATLEPVAWSLDVPELVDVRQGINDGMFSGTVGGAALAFNLAGDMLRYEAQLAFPLSGVAGDYNNNGIVDAADYTAWRDNLGAPAGTLFNDVDGGVIGPAQYATWKANFGNTLGSGSISSTAVPEPAGAILLLSCGSAGLRMRRRIASRVPRTRWRTIHANGLPS